MSRASTPGSPPDARAGVISLRGIAKHYSGEGTVAVTAVDDVSLDVAPSEFLVITGRSGSGKTTLLNIMAGLTTPTDGQVLLDGADIWSLSDNERSRLRNRLIGFIFQFPSLMPSLTVLENITLPVAFGSAGITSETIERARGLLGTVGLLDKADAMPRQLSAGQQQRVVLARALIGEPRIILADEPTSNLDEYTEAEMLALLHEIHETTGVTIVMVTHAAALVSHGTSRLEMAAGRTIPTG